MTTQSLTTTAQVRHRPTAADLAHATPIVTLPTVLVCTGVTVLLTVVANVVGLIVGLLITLLVLLANAHVRRMSIQNAIEDRLEREREQMPVQRGAYLYDILNERNGIEVKR